MAEQQAGGPGGGAKAKPKWLLISSATLAVLAGGAYLWKWLAGVRGADLLGFTALWIAVPLALSMILMFFYFNQSARR